MNRNVFTAMIAVGFAVLTFPPGVARAEQAIAPKTASETSSTPALFMKHTGGWGAGVLAQFTLEKDGAFHWQTKQQKASGRLPKEDVNRLIRDVSSAGDGPGAEDAGYVELKWIDGNGKKRTQDYSYPGKDPCQRLLKEIEDLVAKHGKADADQVAGGDPTNRVNAGRGTPQP